MPRHGAALTALYDAADDDSATGGPDLNRRILPTVSVITEDVFERLPESETEELSRETVARRRGRTCRTPCRDQPRTPTSLRHLTNCLSGSPV